MYSLDAGFVGALKQEACKEMGEQKHFLGQRSFTLQWTSQRSGRASSACSHAYRTSNKHTHKSSDDKILAAWRKSTWTS